MVSLGTTRLRVLQVILLSNRVETFFGFIRYDPIEGTARFSIGRAQTGLQCFIRYDPIEGTASRSLFAEKVTRRQVSLGTTRLRVLQGSKGVRNIIPRSVSLGTTRLRVLQAANTITVHTDIIWVSLGTTRLRVLQVELWYNPLPSQNAFH